MIDSVLHIQNSNTTTNSQQQSNSILMPSEKEIDDMLLQQEISKSATLIRNAKFIIFTAGAGLGIDSGLPAFRTKDGLWKNYPMFEEIGITNLSQMSNPEWFQKEPSLAWGFWSHRASMYRKTKPHHGFDLMLKWATEKQKDQENCFVFTSNVDGQFQKASFKDENVHACHGEVNWLQCTDGNCAKKTGPFPWPQEFASRDPIIDFDPKTLRVRNLEKDAPRCAVCNELARPNVMMFCDCEYVETHQNTKLDNMGQFLAKTRPRETVVVEIGAGTAIPTVRNFSETMAKRGCATIRINPDESFFSPRIANDPDATLVSLPLGSLEALKRIDDEMEKEE